MLLEKKELSLLASLGFARSSRCSSHTGLADCETGHFFPPFCWTGLASPTLLLNSSFICSQKPGFRARKRSRRQRRSSRTADRWVNSSLPIRNPHLPLPSPVAGRLHPEHQPDPAAVSPQSESLIDRAVASIMPMKLKDIPALLVSPPSLAPGTRRGRHPLSHRRTNPSQRPVASDE